MPRVVQRALRFDGTAAQKIAASGIAALRKQAPNQKQVEGLGHDKIVLLPDISMESHRAVPLNLYYKAAAQLTYQAGTVSAQITALECKSERDLAYISRLRDARDELNKKAHVAKQLGYARRTRLQHLMARAFPKARRETYVVASIIFSVGFNILWIPLMIQSFAAMRKHDKEEKERDKKKEKEKEKKTQ